MCWQLQPGALHFIRISGFCLHLFFYTPRLHSPVMTTTLNTHIVTSQAIDVWSVGCILAELFELFKEKTKRSSMPLFTNTMPHFAHHESKLIPSAAAEGPSAVT